MLRPKAPLNSPFGGQSQPSLPTRDARFCKGRSGKAAPRQLGRGHTRSKPASSLTPKIPGSDLPHHANEVLQGPLRQSRTRSKPASSLTPKIPGSDRRLPALITRGHSTPLVMQPKNFSKIFFSKIVFEIFLEKFSKIFFGNFFGIFFSEIFRNFFGNFFVFFSFLRSLAGESWVIGRTTLQHKIIEVRYTPLIIFYSN